MKGPLNMVGETLKSMLGRLNRSEDLDRLPAKVAALINTYDNASEIHPQFRSDMLSTLESVVEMAELMAQPEYDATEVQRHAFNILGKMPTFIKIAENSQLSRMAYAIQNKATRVTLPQIYNTEVEAKEQLRVLGSMMDTSQVEIILIKVSLASGAPPKLPSTGELPKPPPIPQPPEAPLTTEKPAEEKPN